MAPYEGRRLAGWRAGRLTGRCRVRTRGSPYTPARLHACTPAPRCRVPLPFLSAGGAALPRVQGRAGLQGSKVVPLSRRSRPLCFSHCLDCWLSQVDRCTPATGLLIGPHQGSHLRRPTTSLAYIRPSRPLNLWPPDPGPSKISTSPSSFHFYPAVRDSRVLTRPLDSPPSLPLLFSRSSILGPLHRAIGHRHSFCCLHFVNGLLFSSAPFSPHPSNINTGIALSLATFSHRDSPHYNITVEATGFVIRATVT